MSFKYANAFLYHLALYVLYSWQVYNPQSDAVMVSFGTFAINKNWFRTCIYTIKCKIFSILHLFLSVLPLHVMVNKNRILCS